MLNNRKNIYPKKDLDVVLEKIHKVDKKSKLDTYLNESENKTFRNKGRNRTSLYTILIYSQIQLS